MSFDSLDQTNRLFQVRRSDGVSATPVISVIRQTRGKPLAFSSATILLTSLVRLL